MCAALTTAAVINHSLNPPEKGVSWTDFTPNYRKVAVPQAPSLTDEQKQQIEAFHKRVMLRQVRWQKGDFDA